MWMAIKLYLFKCQYHSAKKRSIDGGMNEGLMLILIISERSMAPESRRYLLMPVLHVRTVTEQKVREAASTAITKPSIHPTAILKSQLHNS